MTNPQTPRAGLALWQIAQSIRAAEEESIDRETGELDEELFARLVGPLPMSHEEKSLDISARIVEMKSEAGAIKAAGKTLSDRAAALLRQAAGLTVYLQANIEAGTKFSDTRSAIGWIRSTGTITDERLAKKWQRKTITLAPDLVTIKDALKSGQKIRGAWLEHRNRISIR